MMTSKSCVNTFFFILCIFYSGKMNNVQATIKFPPYQISLVDFSNIEIPVNDAHVCIELINGKNQYAVSDVNGVATFNLPPDAQGTIVISKVGYTTSFLELSNVPNGSILPIKLDMFDLAQVVVTGEGRAVAVDSSIYKVKLINQSKIEETGSLNLGELLLNEANIRMSTDLVLGTQIEMLGLSGQNVKIMIDGVPVIGRLDGNVDLGQINLNNIEQVEVIEGPMSVVYGNNALAGTINLITKQKSAHSTEIKANAFAEHVGRYAGNVALSQKIRDNRLSLDGGYEYFGGVDFDPANRSMDWKPKTLYRANGRYDWNMSDWNVHTKVGVYADKLHYKSNVVDGYKVFDNHYSTQRFDVSAGLKGKWNENNHLDVVASYNYYARSEQGEYKDLRTLKSDWLDKNTSQKVSQKMLRAIQHHDFIAGKLSSQAGIDLNIEEMSGERITDGKKSLGDYAAFFNVRYTPFASLEIQPGLRYAYNTGYTAPLVYSLNAKWNLSKKFVWRASIANGFRAPSIKELHYTFVDSNHELYGNPDLQAETSNNFNSSIEYNTGNESLVWKISGSAYYNEIKDLITLIQEENSTAYTYQNIEEYQSLGGDVSVNFKYKDRFNIRTGYNLTGRYNSFTKANGSDQFNYTHDVFAGLSFNESKSKIKLSADYKYNGELPFFYTDSDDNQIREGFQDAYQTLNASITRGFVKERLHIIAGVKNVFDVTSVNQMRNGSGGAHSSGNGVPISYGRSFFVNVTFKINQ